VSGAATVAMNSCKKSRTDEILGCGTCRSHLPGMDHPTASGANRGVQLAALEKLPAPDDSSGSWKGPRARASACLCQHGCRGDEAAYEGFMKRYPGLKSASVHFSGAAIITRIDSESGQEKPYRTSC